MEYLLDTFEPQKYHLKLDVDKHAETLHGKVEITGVSKHQTIKLHAVEMDILNVLVDGQEATYKNFEQDGIVEITVPKIGKNILEIEFKNKLKHTLEGAYLSTYQHEGKEQRMVVTQFESHFASKCFPCIDEPAAKAVFELEITVPDQQDLVLSNTPIREKKGQTTIFEPTPRMSTYLLAFVIGELKGKSVTNRDGVKITSYCALNQDDNLLDYANEVAARSLEYYGETFGTPYPLPKLDQVALPDFDAGAMENWGLVTYRESCMLAGADSTQAQKRHVAAVVAHELSHQWFGNLVTPKWWDELWLNESFANVLEYFAVDAIYPEYEVWDEFWIFDCFAALKRDALPGVQAVQQPVDNPDEIQSLFDPSIVYAKGAHLMLMLIRLMGKDNFFAGIKDYFAKYHYTNTTGDDLWGVLQPHANFDVKEFMNSWIMKPGYPVITDGKQERFLLNNTTDESKWPLPQVSDDMTGHYVLNISEPDLAKKLEYFADLPLEQRLRIIIDQTLLTKTDRANSVRLFDILEKCQSETDGTVWEMLSTLVGALKLFYENDDKLRQNMRDYLYKLVIPKMSDFSLIPVANETQKQIKYRNAILGMANYTKHEDILQKFADLYDDDFGKIHPELLHLVLSAKMYFDENKYFDRFVERYTTEPDPEYKSALLYAITDARTNESVQKLIDLLGNQKVVRLQDHLHFFLFLRQNHHTRTQALDWLMANWDYIHHANEKSADAYPRYIVNTIYDADEAKKFLKFFDQFRDNAGLARAIEVAHTDVEARLHLLEQDGDAVREVLIG